MVIFLDFNLIDARLNIIRRFENPGNLGCKINRERSASLIAAFNKNFR